MKTTQKINDKIIHETDDTPKVRVIDKDALESLRSILQRGVDESQAQINKIDEDLEKFK